MGSAILRLSEADFSTPLECRGWRGLIEWCLRLDSTIETLESDKVLHRMSIPDGPDEVIFQRSADQVVVSCSYAHFTATCDATDLIGAASNFIRETIRWIDAEYPRARRDPQAQQYWRRL